MERILQFNPKKLLMTVSLDGYKEIHEEMRGISGGFEKTIQTFRELRKMNNRSFKIFLGMTLTEKNVNKLDESFRYVKGIVKSLPRRLPRKQLSETVRKIPRRFSLPPSLSGIIGILFRLAFRRCLSMHDV